MSDKPPSSTIDNIISRILGYMDTPWKAVAVALLFVLFGSGAIIWYERERLIQSLFSSPFTLAKLKKDDIPKALKAIEDYSDVNLVGIWEINVQANRAIFLAGRWRDGTAWTVTPRRVPFIVETSSAKVLVSIFAGHPVCTALDDPDSDAMKRLPIQVFATVGMKRLCIIPVPPNPDILLALLIIAWKEPATSEVEGAALGTAIDASRDLISWTSRGEP